MSLMNNFLDSEPGRLALWTTALAFVGAGVASFVDSNLSIWLAALLPMLVVTGYVAVIALALRDHGEMVIYLLFGLPLLAGLYWIYLFMKEGVNTGLGVLFLVLALPVIYRGVKSPGTPGSHEAH